jgi:putative transcriptional regulator
MIVFRDILQLLAAHGYSSYRIRKEGLIPQSTLTRIRAGGPINTDTLDTICRLCECQPGDLLEYVPGKTKEEG